MIRAERRCGTGALVVDDCGFVRKTLRKPPVEWVNPAVEEKELVEAMGVYSRDEGNNDFCETNDRPEFL